MFAGMALVVAGIAAIIEAHSFPSGYFTPGIPGAPSRLSQTAYDVIRIGGSMLVIFGAVTVIVGLIGYSRGLRTV
jgi:hypothetical protein